MLLADQAEAQRYNGYEELEPANAASGQASVPVQTPSQNVADIAISAAQKRVWAGRLRAAGAEDASDDEDDGGDGGDPKSGTCADDALWDDEEGCDNEYEVISAWDRFYEYLQRDSGSLRMFVLKLSDRQY